MAIDFITALGRLLRDGNLRDRFAASPSNAAEQAQLRDTDLPAWLQLVAADVEFQAAVLLRKRLDIVKYFAPQTCRQAGDHLWAWFHNYARKNWPPEGCARTLDAYQFCRELKTQSPQTICPSEWNRLKFAHSTKRMAMHWVKLPMAHSSGRAGVQMFFRSRDQHWREFLFYFKF